MRIEICSPLVLREGVILIRQSSPTFKFMAHYLKGSLGDSNTGDWDDGTNAPNLLTNSGHPENIPVNMCTIGELGVI